MKILVVRFSSIGDIVLCSPVVRCLKQQLDTEVHFLTKKKFVATIAHNPYVDKIWTIEKDIDEVLGALRQLKFDYIVDLHKNLRTSRLKFALSAESLSFQKLNVEKWLMTNFKINRLPNKHIVDRNMETVATLGVEYDGNGLDFFYPPEEEEKTKSKLAALNFDIEQDYIGFVIGAAHATKRMPNQKVLEIVAGTNLQVLIIGGPAEAEDGAWIASQKPNQITNACGALNLFQSAVAVKQATSIVSPDTGMMHIAAAFQKNINIVWGNTIPEFGMYPFLKNGQFNSFEVNNLSCRPCSKIGYDKCPKGHFKCMEDNEVRLIKS